MLDKDFYHGDQGECFKKFLALEATAGPINPAKIPPNITNDIALVRKDSDETSTAANL